MILCPPLPTTGLTTGLHSPLSRRVGRARACAPWPGQTLSPAPESRAHAGPGPGHVDYALRGGRLYSLYSAPSVCTACTACTACPALVTALACTALRPTASQPSLSDGFPTIPVRRSTLTASCTYARQLTRPGRGAGAPRRRAQCQLLAQHEAPIEQLRSGCVVQGSIPVLLVVLLLVAATVLGAAALAGIFALVTVKEQRVPRLDELL